MKNKEPEPTLYPLGRNIFATVKTWQGVVRIYVHHYKRPTNTKGGRLVRAQRGLLLGLQEFERLVKLKNKLVADVKYQTSVLPADNSNTTTPRAGAAAVAAPSCTDNHAGVTTPPCTPARPSTLRTPAGYLRQCEQPDDFPPTSTLFEQRADNTGGLDILKTATVQAGVVGPKTKGRGRKKTPLPWCPSPPDVGTMDGVLVESHTPVVEPCTAVTEPRSPRTEPYTSQCHYYCPSEDPYILALKKD